MQILSIFLKLQAVKQSGPDFLAYPVWVPKMPAVLFVELFVMEDRARYYQWLIVLQQEIQIQNLISICMDYSFLSSCVRKSTVKSVWYLRSFQFVVISFSWLLFRLDALALSVIATATWLGGWLDGWVAGWLAVTLRYCIKTAKPIGKLFRPSESPITLVFWDPCADTKFQEEPLQRGR